MTSVQQGSVCLCCASVFGSELDSASLFSVVKNFSDSLSSMFSLKTMITPDSGKDHAVVSAEGSGGFGFICVWMTERSSTHCCAGPYENICCTLTVYQAKNTGFAFHDVNVAHIHITVDKSGSVSWSLITESVFTGINGKWVHLGSVESLRSVNTSSGAQNFTYKITYSPALAHALHMYRLNTDYILGVFNSSLWASPHIMF